MPLLSVRGGEKGFSMARRPHFSSDPSDERPTPMTPSAITKVEFGRTLQKMLHERHWNQSEFMRRIREKTGSTLGRDAISTYITGKRFPTPSSIAAMAETLGVERDELFPNGIARAMEDEVPEFELRAAAGHPGKAWLRINRMMSFRTASEIAKLIDAENQRDAAE